MRGQGEKLQFPSRTAARRRRIWPGPYQVSADMGWRHRRGWACPNPGRPVSTMRPAQPGQECARGQQRLESSHCDVTASRASPAPRGSWGPAGSGRAAWARARVRARSAAGLGTGSCCSSPPPFVCKRCSLASEPSQPRGTSLPALRPTSSFFSRPPFGSCC